MTSSGKIKAAVALIALAGCLFSATQLPAAQAELLYKQGIEAFNSGNYGSAELIFRRIKDLRNDEYLDRAWFHLARSIFHQKQYKSALYEFNSFLNKCSSGEYCLESRFWMGETHYNLNDYVKAIEQYNRYILAAKKGPLAVAAHDRIGSIYFSQMRYDEAIIEWEDSIKLSDDRDGNAVRLLQIGEALFKNRRYDDALNRLAPLLTAQTGVRVSAMARLISGQILQMQNDHRKALLVLNGIPGNLLNEKPFIEAQYFKGISNLALGSDNAAKSLFELFILVGKDSPWYYNALFQLGSIQAQSKDWKKAAMLLEEARKSSPDRDLRFQASKLLSKIYMDRDPRAALPYLEESLSEDNPDEHKDSILIMTRIYINVRDFAKATAALDQFFLKYPYDSRIDEGIFLQAVILLEQGDMNRSQDLFTRIQKEYPFSPYVNESHFYLGQVYFRKGEYRSALGALGRYVKFSKIEKKYEAWILLFNSYAALNDSKNSAAALQYLMTNYPDGEGIEQIIYDYAIGMHKKKQNAWNYFSILMKKYPDSGPTMDLYQFLGNEYYDKNDHAKAVYYYELFIKGEKTIEKGGAFFNMLHSLMSLKKYNEIIAYIQQGTVPPMNEEQWREIPLFLSRSYYHLGNLEKSYTIMYSTDLSRYSAGDLMIFVRASLFVGDIDSAVEASLFMKNDPAAHSDARLLLGTYSSGRGEYERALVFFESIASEMNGSQRVQQAQLEIAKIFFAQKRFDEALKRLDCVTAPGFSPDKNALTILMYFEQNQLQQALSLTETSQMQLKKSDMAEAVLKRCLEHYFQQGDVKNFLRYARLLAGYKNIEAYLAYLTAMIYYNTGAFRTASQHFTLLSKMESPHLDESLYYLGLINGMVFNNARAALNYFEQLAAKKDLPELLSLKVKINLALLLFEAKRDSEARVHLNDVIASTNRGLLRTQALNLLEFFQTGEKTIEQ
jgi:TolA-binding protein